MFKDRLREFRKNQGLTVQQMADFIGKPKPTYESYESGKSEPPLIVIEKTMDLGLNLNWLITGSGEMLLSSTECQECRAKERELLDLHRENKSLRNHEACTEEKRLETLIERCCDRVIDKLKVATPREAPLQQKKPIPAGVDS
jgi:transcriptional regulator with XRE-family HTH domain